MRFDIFQGSPSFSLDTMLIVSVLLECLKDCREKVPVFTVRIKGFTANYISEKVAVSSSVFSLCIWQWLYSTVQKNVLIVIVVID